MTAPGRLERDLTAWFAETAAPRTPDYVDDILRVTAMERQRSRRAFPPSWGWRPAVRSQVRLVLLLALLALLIAATLALYVGSQPPPPYGLADNGLVAYSDGGDIMAVDPASGRRIVITASFEDDRVPRYSPDGTHLAFVRSKPDGHHIVIVGAEGDRPVESKMPLVEIDTDSLAWSQDGRQIAVGAAATGIGARSIFLVEAIDGTVEEIKADYHELPVHWRPSHGREVMYVSGTWGDLRLSLHRLEGGEVVTFPPLGGDNSTLRPIGWTPDGHQFAYQVWHPERGAHVTHVLDVETGSEFVLPVAHGLISNDGERIVGFDGKGDDHQLCVARIRPGAHCTPIGGATHGPNPEHSAALQWAPNDQFILSHGVDGSTRVIDPGGKLVDQPAWLEDGGETWQRR